MRVIFHALSVCVTVLGRAITGKPVRVKCKRS
jgi:hypothetical protein